MTALTEPVHRAIASRLRRGQTSEQLYSVGERTGWWTGDDVDWATSGGEGPRPEGWTLPGDDPTPTDTPVLVAPDGSVQTLREFVGGITMREAAASCALDGETQVIDGPVTVGKPVTVDVGEVVPGSSYVGIVLVDQVFADAHYQRPLQRARAAAMAKAWNPRMVAVIDVSDRGAGTVGRRFAVVNGQHRWAAAQMAGVTQLAATIHEGLDRAGEARLMYELDRGTKALTSWDKWRARLAAGDEHVLAVEQIATAHGLTCAPSSFGAVGAAETVLRRDGHKHLATTVLLLTTAWGSTAAAVKAPLLTGMATVLRATGVDAQRLVDALRGTSPAQVHARAAAMRELDGGSLSALTARAMVTAYNSRPGPKLALP